MCVVVMLGRLLRLLVMAGLCATQAASALQFEWAAPLPHRQSWRSLAAGNGMVVGLTEGFGGRSIYASPDGKQWRPVTSPTNVAFQKVVFSGNQFIAVGPNSTVISSKDGIDWKIRHTDTAGHFLFDIASGNGVHVAIGHGPFAIVSSDLVTWSNGTGLGTGYVLRAVEFGNGRFVALGEYGSLFTSTDGAAWSRVPWPVDLADGYSLEFNNGVFLIPDGNGIGASTDGVHWTVKPNSLGLAPFAHANGFLGVNSSGVYQSSNGSDWSLILAFDQSESGMNNRITCSAVLNGSTILGGDQGLMYVSPDMVNWERLLKRVDYGDSKIAYGNGVYVRHGGATGLCISSNGSDWQRIESAPGLKAAAFGNGFWIGLDHAGNAVISSNAKSWESLPLPATAGERIEFADGRFVAEAQGGILTSMDGRNWQFVSIADGLVRLIGRTSGIWAGSSKNGPVTSADGVIWTIHPLQEMGAAVYAAGNGRFIGLVGAGMGPGFVKLSTDGFTWTSMRLTSGTTHPEQSLTFGGGMFVMTDNHGDVFQSEDGVNWVGARQAEQVFTSAVYGNSEWLVCGGDSILRSNARVQSPRVLKLQLALQDANAWSLWVAGNAGETLQIESTADLNGPWLGLQKITIPQSGQALVPTEISTPNRFFRATVVAP
jgi:hypothetical protein